MTVKKLSDSDKNEILKLYRETGETTSTLAERYGVSNSTISRFLKSTLPDEEYEVLIASKRAARTSVGDSTQTQLFSEPEPAVAVAEPLAEVQPKLEPEVESTSVSRRLRRRSSGVSKPEIEMPATAEIQLQLLDAPEVSKPTLVNQDALTQPVSQPEYLVDHTAAVSDRPSQLDRDSDTEANTLAELLGEDLLDESEELIEEDEDLEDLDEDDLDEDAPILTRRMPTEMLVQVLPLSEAILPKTCYLVIDRLSELITRPLRDFGELGQIPTQEVQQKTLPVFDNHKVARRFSTKRDRVIKVPDSRMLQKTRSQLAAKGITRLLVDGQVYSLST